jgi:hypothetical protein
MQLIKFRSTGEVVVVGDRPQRPAPQVKRPASKETATPKGRR